MRSPSVASDDLWPNEIQTEKGPVKTKFHVCVCHRGQSHNTYVVDVHAKRIKLKSSVPCTKALWEATRKSITEFVLATKPCMDKVGNNYIFNYEKEPKKGQKPDPKNYSAERRNQFLKAQDKYLEQHAAYKQRLQVGLAEWDDEDNPKTEYHHVRDILMTVSLPNSDISAFLLGSDRSFEAEGAYYIDVVCGGGGAKAAMMTFLHQFDDRNVRLSALLHVLGYYPRFYHFKFGKTCEERDRYKDIDLEPLKGLTGEDFSAFTKPSLAALQDLMRKKLFNNENNLDVCDTTDDPREFLKNNCHQNGFHQIRCRS